jgi:ligand-binding sensor domain-containing protein
MNRHNFILSVFWGIVFLIVNGCSSSKPSAPTRPVWTNYEINASVFTLAFEGNDVWVGTEQGLIKYDLTQDRIVARYDSKNGLASDIITTVKIDSQGNKWVGMHGGGLAKFDGKTWRLYNVPDLADPYVYDILFDRDGRMWVANWKGVSIFDGTKWKSYTKADGIIDDWVYALTMDRDGVIWLGTEGGVTRYDGRLPAGEAGQFVSYTHKDGVGADLKTIGSYEKIANPSFHHQTTPGKEAEGYNPNYILAAAVDSRNNKWFGTWGAGLSRFDGKTWTTYTTRDGLSGNFISDILVDWDDTLYVATEGGVSVLSQDRWKSYTSKDGLVDDGVFTAVVDALGFKWFGTLKGISKLEGFSAFL